ncbi:hypothetical protein GCM10023185_11720 [Hymenobacter saemangeumensis]|uniref:Peptidase M28 domain-containing protein n=1 Tax=Hymenobacter saemangeumensis TaxID=1084522 RepID=A0ABP8I684_9BACT
MKKSFLLALLAFTSACATAQTPSKTKIKVKSSAKPAETTTVPATATPPTRQAPVDADWNAHYGAQVTAERLRTHLAVLASDEYEGRETGEKGQHMAAAYIARQFQEAGLTGPVQKEGGPYLQTFQLEHVTWAEGASLKVGGTTYKWMTDFYGLGDAGFTKETEVQPLFVGYGIEQDGYSDYKGKSVAGKDLIMLLGEPSDASGKPVLSPDGNSTKWSRDYRAKADLAAQKGARSVFFVDFNPNSNFAKLAARLAPYINRPSIMMAGERSDRAPSFFVSPAVGYKLLGTNEGAIAKYTAKTAEQKQPVAASFKASKLRIKAPRQRTPFGTENVLGYVEGSDKKDEVLVISAHHDHLGVKDGKVFNGADDDGSGTSAIINIAEAFARAKKEGHGPRRSLLFLSVTGEEEGLYGSEYYSNHPIFPLASTVADLNVDMIGRTDPEHEGKADYVYVIGSDKLASQLKVINEAQNKQYTQLDLDYRFDDPNDPNRFYYRSDHYNFAVKKVPVAFYFNGVHADYHEETDEVEKIQFDKMEKRARLVFHTAWELANREERILVDSNKP